MFSKCLQVKQGEKLRALEFLRFVVDFRVSYRDLSRSYQERALPTELCGPPALYSGGGRIRTYAALTGGRFTVCSD